MRHGFWTTLLAALLVVVLGTACASASRNTIALCYVPEYSETGSVVHFHGQFATQYLASQYPGVSFSWTPYAIDGNRNFSTAIASLLSMPDDCSVLVGPISSRFSIATSPLVARPWLSSSASSTSLSDKQAHKWFSRVIPSDAYGGSGIAALLSYFGWERAHVICSDEPYGISLAAGFTSAYEAHGTVESSSCFSLGTRQANYDHWVVALRAIRDTSATRIVVVAHVEPDAAMVDAIMALGMDKTHVFVLGEVCDTSDPAVSALYGALCATYATSGTEDYLAAYAARDTTASLGDIVRYGLPDVSPTSSDLYGLLTVDLVRHVMSTSQDLFAANNSVLNVSPANFDWFMAQLRNRTSSGFSGTVSFTDRGDREGAAVAFVNLQPTRPLTFALWSSGTDPRVIDGENLYWLNSGYSTPPAAIMTGPSVPDLPIFLIAGCICGGIFLILLVVMAIKLRSVSRDKYAQLVRSGIILTFAKIVAHSVDIGTDVLSCVVVVTRGKSSTTFVTIYVCLTVIAVAASLVEVVVLVLQFLETLASHGDLSVAREVEWEKRFARAAVISLIAEDLPMAVIATVAIKEQADIPLLVSLLLSTILFGSKATYIPPLVHSIMRRKSTSAEDSADGPRLNSQSSTSELDAAAALIQKDNPDRYEQLRQHAIDAVVLCREQQIDQNEFFAAVWQRTASLYESGTTNDENQRSMLLLSPEARELSVKAAAADGEA
jgi:ABC-type branched-subunit amino acid transport system substrate-binding protein